MVTLRQLAGFAEATAPSWELPPRLPHQHDLALGRHCLANYLINGIALISCVFSVSKPLLLSLLHYLYATQLKLSVFNIGRTAGTLPRVEVVGRALG